MITEKARQENWQNNIAIAEELDKPPIDGSIHHMNKRVNLDFVGKILRADNGQSKFTEHRLISLAYTAESLYKKISRPRVITTYKQRNEAPDAYEYRIVSEVPGVE